MFDVNTVLASVGKGICIDFLDRHYFINFHFERLGLFSADYTISKKISNDQELYNQIPYPALKTQKDRIHKLTAVYEKHTR